MEWPHVPPCSHKGTKPNNVCQQCYPMPTFHAYAPACTTQCRLVREQAMEMPDVGMRATWGCKKRSDKPTGNTGCKEKDRLRNTETERAGGLRTCQQNGNRGCKRRDGFSIPRRE